MTPTTRSQGQGEGHSPQATAASGQGSTAGVEEGARAATASGIAGEIESESVPGSFPSEGPTVPFDGNVPPVEDGPLGREDLSGEGGETIPPRSSTLTGGQGSPRGSTGPPGPPAGWATANAVPSHDTRARIRLAHPVKYSGKDESPRILRQWLVAVRGWLIGSGVNPNSVQAFSYALSCLEGKAQEFVSKTFAREVFLSDNPNETSPVSLQQVHDALFERFGDKFASTTAQRKFEALAQHSREGTYLTVPELVERIEEYEEDMVQCSDYDKRRRLFDAVDPKIAKRLAQEGHSPDMPSTFLRTKEAAIRAERGELAVRRINESRKAGDTRNLSNWTAMSYDTKADKKVKEKDEPSQKGNPKRAVQKSTVTFPVPSTVVKKSYSSTYKAQTQKPKRDRLSDEEYEKRKKSGACFNCGEVGHAIKDCPKMKTQAKVAYMATEERNKFPRNTARIQPNRLFADAVRGISSDSSDSSELESMADTSNMSEEEHSEQSEAEVVLQADSDKTRGKALQAEKAIPDQPQRSKALSPRIPKAIIDTVKEDEPKDESDSSIELDVRVGDHVAVALLDSGSDNSYISPHTVRALRLKTHRYLTPYRVNLATKNSKVKAEQYVYVDIKIGDLEASQRFEVLNIRGTDLILGRNFMSRHRARITIDKTSVIEFLSPNGNATDKGSVVTCRPNGATKAYSPNLSMLKNSDWDPDYYPDEEVITAFKDRLIAEFGDVLVDDSAEPELPPFRHVNHRIPLKDENQIIRKRTYKVADKLRDKFIDYHGKQVKAGVWEPRSVESASPMLVLEKKNGEVRPTVDLRERNANTKLMHTVLPNQEDIRNRVAAARFRSQFDGSGMFQQIRVVPEDVHKTAFSTIRGTTISHVAQQGDLNSPNTCQRVMEHEFREYIGRWLEIYLDDAYVFNSDSWGQHKAYVILFLRQCRASKIKLTRRKMYICPQQTEVLGSIVRGHEIILDPKKVDAIQRFERPQDRKAVQRFMGMVNYLSRHLPHLASIAAPIALLASNTETFNWTMGCDVAFEDVKDMIKNAVAVSPIIASELAKPEHEPFHLESAPANRFIYDNNEPGKHLFLFTDASLVGAGSLLAVGYQWWNAVPFAFHSKKFNTAEQNYSVDERELLAIVLACKHFDQQLRGQRVNVITDNKSLVWLKTKAKIEDRLARWYNILSVYDLHPNYIKGEENVVADALSRQFEKRNGGGSKPPSTYLRSSTSTHADNSGDCRRSNRRQKPVSYFEEEDTNEIARERQKKIDAQKTKRQSNKGKARDAQAYRPANTPMSAAERAEAQRQRETDQMDNSQAARSEERWETPETAEVLLDAEYEPELLFRMSQAYEKDVFFKKIWCDPGINPNFEIAPNGNGVKLIHIVDQDGSRRLCIPQGQMRGRSFRELMLENSHEAVGHAAFEKTYAHFRELVYWPGMYTDVQLYCKSCPSCQAVKTETQKPMGKLHSLPIETEPWASVAIDFQGPLPWSKTANGTKVNFLMNVIDMMSSEVESIPTTTECSAEDCAKMFFERIYARHGMPLNIVSDQDVRWKGSFWKTLHSLVGTTLSMSTAYHPQSNGKIERMHRRFNEIFRQVVDENQQDWAEHVPYVQFAVNNTKSSTTGFAPCQLTRGYIPNVLPAALASGIRHPDRRATDFAEKAVLNQKRAIDATLQARILTTSQANKHRRSTADEWPDILQCKDRPVQAYVSTKNWKMVPGPTRKFCPRYVGPFSVISFNNRTDVATIDLPRRYTSRGISNTFHISELKRFIGSNEEKFPHRLTQQTPLFPIDKDPMTTPTPVQSMTAAMSSTSVSRSQRSSSTNMPGGKGPHTATMASSTKFQHSPWEPNGVTAKVAFGVARDESYAPIVDIVNHCLNRHGEKSLVVLRADGRRDLITQSRFLEVPDIVREKYVVKESNARKERNEKVSIDNWSDLFDGAQDYRLVLHDIRKGTEYLQALGFRLGETYEYTKELREAFATKAILDRAKRTGAPPKRRRLH